VTDFVTALNQFASLGSLVGGPDTVGLVPLSIHSVDDSDDRSTVEHRLITQATTTKAVSRITNSKIAKIRRTIRTTLALV
jgi:hypothetical protein